MKRALLLIFTWVNAGCFTAWDVGGPWACSDGGVCADGFTCDDGVCCKVDGTPRCPTLPFEGTCPFGSKPDTYYRDVDGDSAGALATGRVFCRAPVKEPWVKDSTDCDDGDPAIGPLASERCNAQDDDCDGVIDEGLSLQTWYRDTDQDGFGEECASCRLDACTQPLGFAARAGDCAPGNAAVFPGAAERCNQVDDNCNGQLDDPPFVDVENPGSTSQTFDCDTGQQGICRPGGMQCIFSTSSFAPVCVARVTATVDVCGDSIDSDCSGTVDDRPGCRGPDSLLTAPGISFGALTFYDAGLPSLPPLPARCMKNQAGGEAMAWLNPSWIGSGSGLHLWYAEAPAGTWWDLSQASALRLPVVSSAVGSIAAGVWTMTARFDNAVIHLCGDAETDFQRYTPTAVSQRFTTGPQIVRVPLRPVPADGWSVSNAAFDLSRVRRIEVLVAPEKTDGGVITFTNRFLTDAGLVGFEP
ncbi:MAG: putative metal-binding motif-containing protein [Archangium sp.]|nr:putative metal-binding motif-containing protein [Archangium sp.]MDP3571387.1 putative metal-binding motif-containing protein [Archangium sp.]